MKCFVGCLIETSGRFSTLAELDFHGGGELRLGKSRESWSFWNLKLFDRCSSFFCRQSGIGLDGEHTALIERPQKEIVVVESGLILLGNAVHGLGVLGFENDQEGFWLGIGILLNIQDVGEFGCTDFSLDEWDQLMGLTGIPIVGCGCEIVDV